MRRSTIKFVSTFTEQFYYTPTAHICCFPSILHSYIDKEQTIEQLDLCRCALLIYCTELAVALVAIFVDNDNKANSLVVEEMK